MSSVAIENYQLKWSSHQNNLNAAVSSLLRTEKFTDVLLLTSHPNDVAGESGIHAHKLILSSCSEYFASIFNSNTSSLNSFLYVILPSELSRRSLQVLVQYMYNGEATVSQDILNEVLRGGELLKIRGLWRNSGCQHDESRTECNHSDHNDTVVDTHNAISANDVNGIRSTNGQSVIIAQTKIIESNKSYNSLEGRISINKDIARDPAKSYLQHINTVKKISSNELQHNNERKRPKDNVLVICDSKTPRLNNSVTTIAPVSESIRNSIDIKIKNEPESDDIDQTIPSVSMEVIVKPEILCSIQTDVESESTRQDDLIYSPLACEICGELFEIPAEWVRHTENHNQSNNEVSRKLKRPNETPTGSAHCSDIAALRCDLCELNFNSPAEWVRHIQKRHTENELAISNNLKCSNRDNPDDAATTKVCNVCNKTFPSYASILMHTRTHTGERPYACRHCHKGFNVKSNLLRHMRTVHNECDG